MNGAVTLDLGLGGNSAPGQDGGSNVDYATVTLTAPMAAATCKEAAEVSATPDATACAGVTGAQVRKPPSWPRSWANSSPLSLHSHRDARGNSHL